VIFRGIGLAILVLAGACAQAAEVIPPSPAAHFNDYASVVSPATAASLDSKLDQFERETSNQIVVAIFPTMQSDSSVEDYTVRVAQSWHAGMAGKSNGAVLFIFVDSHQIRIQVGYGLEATLTDALAKDIISDRIAPAFRRGDYDAGVTEGVDSMIAATRGEYHGSGRTVGDRRRQGSPSIGFIFAAFVIIVMISTIRRRAAMYQNGGRRGLGGFMPIFLPGGFGGGGGGFGGGGGGGGGFSGGGGGFGGGGAGGSW
jgi:uncharacterized protein